MAQVFRNVLIGIKGRRQLKMKINSYTLFLIAVVPESAVCFLGRNWEK